MIFMNLCTHIIRFRVYISVYGYVKCIYQRRFLRDVHLNMDRYSFKFMSLAFETSLNSLCFCDFPECVYVCLGRELYKNYVLRICKKHSYLFEYFLHNEYIFLLHVKKKL